MLLSGSLFETICIHIDLHPIVCVMLKCSDISVRLEVLTVLPQPLDATMLVDRDGTCVSIETISS